MALALYHFLFVAGVVAWVPPKYDTSAKRASDGTLNVHLVAHTHDDVGWLKTVDQYYAGLKGTIQQACVKCILDSLIPALSTNPDRKFIYVEQAFFQRWWSEQDAATRAQTRGFVANGQLEMINGGWSMHDEANPDYVSMVDQTTLGHRFILEEFNATPRVTWQIDPFGHTATQASLLSSAWSGFQGLFFGRADAENIAQRRNTTSMEMIWMGSKSLGTSGATFTGINNNLYQPPNGFCYDVWCTDDPIQDNPDLEDYNVPEIVELFVQTAKAQAASYRSNDILWTMGSDFQYIGALAWFTRLDKLIHYVNADGRVRALYSTPSIYTTAKISSTVRWPVKAFNDFMPYIPGPHKPMVGFYTSRPALKGYIRETMSYQQAARQLQTLTGGADTDLGPSNPLYLLERALGVTQHHDAVSGTSKQAVAYDYEQRLALGRASAELLVADALRNLTNASAETDFAACDYANATICPALEAGLPTAVVIYNSLGQPVSPYCVRLPVGLPSGVGSYSVLDSLGAKVLAQLEPVAPTDTQLREGYYQYAAGPPVAWLVFEASLPPMGFATYYLLPLPGEPPVANAVPLHASGPNVSLSNGIVSLEFDTASGLLKSWTDFASQTTTAFTQALMWYNSSAGNADATDNSGAYDFRPNSSTPFPIGPVSTTIVASGPVLYEALQVFSPWASQKIRLWASSATVEFEWTVGPIPWQDGWGKEVISRYSTDLATNATWWTDSNGRDMMERVRDWRPDFNYTPVEPVAGNYYPVPAAIATVDTSRGIGLSVSTDRSEGGSSIFDGSLELMVHRRLQHDDGWGVGEPLNETGFNANGTGLVIRGVHRVSLGPAAGAAAARRINMQHSMFPPLLRFASLGGQTPAEWSQTHVTTKTGLRASLPDNVHLMTTHSQGVDSGSGKQSLLLRLAHLFEEGEDGALGTNVTVSLQPLFAGFDITSAVERTLTNNQPLASVPTVTYLMQDGESITVPQVPASPAGDTLDVTLSPMQVRTFLCDIE